MYKRGNANRPARGASIKVYPIRKRADIDAIKTNLRNQPRNLCLFVMGINTAYRASELLSLTIGKVAGLSAGDMLEIKQRKNQKYRAVTLNQAVVDAIGAWLAVHPKKGDYSAPLFISQHKNHAIGVSALSRLTKDWCEGVNLPENYASHTLRKTWGYQQRLKGVSVALLMRAYGHANEAQTLEYLCIQPKEIQALYTELEL